KRLAEQAARNEDRRRVAEERAAAQETAAAMREAGQQEHTRKLAEAEFRTEAITAKIVDFEKLLANRNRQAGSAALELEATLVNRGATPFVERLQYILAQSRYPEGLTGRAAAHYDSNSHELLIEYELPLQTVVPVVVGYRYTKAKGLTLVPRKESETKKIYGDLLARLTLRTLAEAFDATPVGMVTGIVFNGYVATIDKATGQPIRPLLISINAERKTFAEVQL